MPSDEAFWRIDLLDVIELTYGRHALGKLEPRLAVFRVDVYIRWMAVRVIQRAHPDKVNIVGQFLTDDEIVAPDGDLALRKSRYALP